MTVVLVLVSMSTSVANGPYLRLLQRNQPFILTVGTMLAYLLCTGSWIYEDTTSWLCQIIKLFSLA